MIELKQVSKRWEHRTVLHPLSLRIHAGECTAILGANGAGKSTLLKLIAMLMQPTAGAIFIEGQPLAEAPAAIRRQIGYVFHSSSFYPHLTALENLKIVCRLYGTAASEQRLTAVLAKVGLRLARDERVQNFSRGMTQRLSIARVLLTEARILLLDEPHTGLDQEGVRWLNGLIQERLTAGVTVLLVSHDLGQVHELADRVLWLENGRIAKDLSRCDLSAAQFEQQVFSW